VLKIFKSARFLSILIFVLFFGAVALGSVSSWAISQPVQKPASKSEIAKDAGKDVSKNAAEEAQKKAVVSKMMKLQIPFIENQGQVKDKSVKFYANTFAGNVYVTEKGEIVYGLVKAEEKVRSSEFGVRSRTGVSPVSLEKSRNRSSDLLIEKTNTPEGVFLQEAKKVAADQKLKADSRVLMATLKETLIGAKELKVSGEDKAETKVNYFIGNKKDWKSNISSYNEVSLGEVYKNIELKLKAYGNNVEKLFVVKPGGNVKNISLNLEGSKSLKVNKNGELEVETELGSVKFTKPYAYQEIDGKRVEVECKFEVQNAKGKEQSANSELPKTEIASALPRNDITPSTMPRALNFLTVSPSLPTTPPIPSLLTHYLLQHL